MDLTPCHPLVLKLERDVKQLQKRLQLQSENKQVQFMNEMQPAACVCPVCAPRGGRVQKPVPTQWTLIVKAGCPYCTKAQSFFREHRVNFRQWTARNPHHGDEIQKREGLVAEQGYRTFPRIFSPMGEFFGGADDLQKLLLGTITYSFADVPKEHKQPMRLVIQHILPIYAPFARFRETGPSTAKSHITIRVQTGEALVESLVQRGYQRSRVAEFRTFSVTLMDSHDIYFNQDNILNTTGKTTHFDGNRLGYLIYVVLHEMLHAIGFAHHTDGEYAPGADCCIMSQQTRPMYGSQCRLMTFDRIRPYLRRPDDLLQKLQAVLGGGASVIPAYAGKSSEKETTALSETVTPDVSELEETVDRIVKERALGGGDDENEDNEKDEYTDFVEELFN